MIFIIIILFWKQKPEYQYRSKMEWWIHFTRLELDIHFVFFVASIFLFFPSASRNIQRCLTYSFILLRNNNNNNNSFVIFFIREMPFCFLYVCIWLKMCVVRIFHHYFNIKLSYFSLGCLVPFVSDMDMESGCKVKVELVNLLLYYYNVFFLLFSSLIWRSCESGLIKLDDSEVS